MIAKPSVETRNAIASLYLEHMLQVHPDNVPIWERRYHYETATYLNRWLLRYPG